jgi:hypothetical protein
VKIKRIALLVIVALTFFSIGIYSQTRQLNSLLAVPGTTYSGADLGFTVTGTSTGGVDGHFAIRVNGDWIPIPSTKQASGKVLQSN